MQSDSPTQLAHFLPQQSPPTVTPSRSKALKRKYKQLELIRQSEHTPHAIHTITDHNHTHALSLKKQTLLREYKNAVLSHTEVKREKQYEPFSDLNIFKLPSAHVLTNKNYKLDLRLPTLDKRRLNEQEMPVPNPQRRKTVKIPIDKLKPLPADEVKRRFMIKYQLQGIKARAD